MNTPGQFNFGPQDSQFGMSPMTPINQSDRPGFFANISGRTMEDSSSDSGIQTPLLASNAQKRARVDSGIGQSRDQAPYGPFRPMHINVVGTDGTPVSDVADMLSWMVARHNETSAESSQQAAAIRETRRTIEALEARISELEQSLAATTGGGESADSEKKQRKVYNKPVTDACQATSKALLGVTEIRVTGENRPVLILPHPLGPDEPNRMEGGQRLWNPNWLALKPFSDPLNIQFIDAVVSTVIQNGRAPGAASEISPEDLDNVALIKAAAQQYFTTLIKKYKINEDEGAKAKSNEKAIKSRRAGRKKTKQVRRAGSVGAFEARHGIAGIKDLVQKEYMSSEDDEPNNVDRKLWDEKAKKYARKGQDVVEVCRVKWRQEKLSRMYYALDKIAFTGDSKVKTVNARFHGFKENARNERPKGKVPRYIVSEAWLKATNNEMMIMGTGPCPIGWDDLVIDDEEIDLEDLAAMKEWNDDDMLEATAE